ncbi:MAG: hypothetical protein ACRDZ5_11805, partial [Acidimicrobiales bacterium]
EHYMGWLGGVRPDLVELCERRFGKRSYQPDNEQRRIAAIVRDAFESAGGRSLQEGADTAADGQMSGSDRVLASRSWSWTGIVEPVPATASESLRQAQPEQLSFAILSGGPSQQHN